MLGALVAVAVGFGAVLWLTRGGDETASDDPSDESTDDPGEDPGEATDTSVEPTAPPTTVVLTLPSTAPPPSEPASTAPAPTTAPAPPTVTVTVPAGAVPYVDPTGWSLQVDPTWRFQQTPEFTGWFTNTGTAQFQDNVNVVAEQFAQPTTLDEYVTAALDLITRQASDATVLDQRRVVGTDGVEVAMITWTGTLPGLPTLVFLQAVTVTPERAHIATFTTEPGRMQDLAPVIGPYLSTIRPA